MKRKEKVGTQPSQLLPGSVITGLLSVLSGLKKDYGGKRCVFNEERNKGKVGQDRKYLYYRLIYTAGLCIAKSNGVHYVYHDLRHLRTKP